MNDKLIFIGFSKEMTNGLMKAVQNHLPKTKKSANNGVIKQVVDCDDSVIIKDNKDTCGDIYVKGN